MCNISDVAVAISSRAVAAVVVWGLPVVVRTASDAVGGGDVIANARRTPSAVFPAPLVARRAVGVAAVTVLMHVIVGGVAVAFACKRFVVLAKAERERRICRGGSGARGSVVVGCGGALTACVEGRRCGTSCGADAGRGAVGVGAVAVVRSVARG